MLLPIFLSKEIILMNCAEKLLEPTIFFNLHTKSPYNPGSESPRLKRDLIPNWNLGILMF